MMIEEFIWLKYHFTAISKCLNHLNNSSGSFSYNLDGTRNALSAPFLPGSHAFSYGYDAAGRMTGLLNPSGLSAAWSYSADNILQQQQLGNGVLTNYGHNALGQQSSLTNLAPGGLTANR